MNNEKGDKKSKFYNVTSAVSFCIHMLQRMIDSDSSKE